LLPGESGKLDTAATRPMDRDDYPSQAFGLGRSLVATATLLTLASNGPSVLFASAKSGRLARAGCLPDGASAGSIFCLYRSEEAHLNIVRWLAIASLVAVISGWRPRFTCLVHFWIAFSVFWSIPVADGGDQAALIFAALSVPICLTDGRRFHWAPELLAEGTQGPLMTLGQLLLRAQLSVVYLWSGVAKLGSAEWRDGTAMYYWLYYAHIPNVGRKLFRYGDVTAPITWGVIVTELAIALSCTAGVRVRHNGLRLLIALHVLIALLFGLVSFSLTMIGAGLMTLTWGAPRLRHKVA
jgi:antimicrobial peptide system SdpB family protein